MGLESSGKAFPDRLVAEYEGRADTRNGEAQNARAELSFRGPGYQRMMEGCSKGALSHTSVPNGACSG